MELNESEDSDQYHQEDPESGNSDEEETDEETEEEEEEQPDFWSLMIQEKAQKIHNDRLAADLPGPDQEIQGVYQLL